MFKKGLLATLLVTIVLGLVGCSSNTTKIDLTSIDEVKDMNQILSRFKEKSDNSYTDSFYENNKIKLEGSIQEDFSKDKKIEEGLALVAECTDAYNNMIDISKKYVKNNTEELEREFTSEKTILDGAIAKYILGIADFTEDIDCEVSSDEQFNKNVEEFRKFLWE